MTEIDLVLYLYAKMVQGTITIEETRKLNYYLLRNEEAFRNCWPTLATVVHEDKIMFIADSHFAENDKREEWYMAYNTALKQGIKTVIHLGDFVEGCCRKEDWNKSEEELSRELQYAISQIPTDVMTKLLLGNHDYSVIRNHPPLIDLYFSAPNLDIMGMHSVFLCWERNMTIHLFHQVSQLTLLAGHLHTKLNYDFQIKGHEHIYHYDLENKTIILPPIYENENNLMANSLRFICGENIMEKPTFLIASKEDEEHFLFEMNWIVLEKYRLSPRKEQFLFDAKTKALKKIK